VPYNRLLLAIARLLPKAEIAIPRYNPKVMGKRRIFDELMEGVAAMKAHREGKLTLRTYKV